MSSDRRWHAAALAMCLIFAVFVPRPAGALVVGERQQIYAQHRVYGAAVITGNTLMSASISAPEVNSVLLPRSAGDVRNIPFDAEIVGAYLFWSGSLNQRVDDRADLTLPDGTFFNDLRADRCVTVQPLGGFYYCRKNVTEQVRGRAGPQGHNGTYVVGDVDAMPGFINAEGNCVDPSTCQAKYAAWSLVLVYEAASARALRDVFVYDGFRMLDETANSPGIDQFDIVGFDFPEAGSASISFFGLEGDAFLGVPPQDTDPVFPCNNCFDFMEFNGVRLSDANNPPGNLFNSTSPGGYTLGLDLDTFDVSARLRAGDSQARIRVGSGDGIVEGRQDSAGHGEMFLLGWVLLNVDRNAPNFRRAGTFLSVVPDEAAPRERVVITLRLTNEGTRDAPNTRVTLPLPNGLTYLAGSLRINGADPVPGDEVNNPLANGFNLGNVPFRGDNERVITLRASINAGVPPGTRLISQGTIRADTLDEPTETNEAVLVVLGEIALGGVTKTARDADGDGRFTPGEIVRYEIRLQNPSDRDLAAVSLVDTLPPQLELLQVVAPGGVDQSRPAENRVELHDLPVPGGPGGGTTVVVLARIRDVPGLLASGVPPGGIEGFRVSNQAVGTAGGVDTRSDDPTTPVRGDPTTFPLSSGVDIGGPGTRKTVEALDGAPLQPGDRLRYTISVANTGGAPAEVFVQDPLPAGTEACVLESGQPNLVCGADRLQGLITVPPNGVERIIFTVRVRGDVADGLLIRNVANLRPSADPGQTIDVQSEALQVVAGPDLSRSTKVVTDGLVGGRADAGATLTWAITVRNTGNRPATNIVVTDRVDFPAEPIVPLDGGVLDPGSRTITWRLPRLEPGASETLRLRTTVPTGTDDGTVLANQGQMVAAERPRPTLTDDPSTPAPNDATRVIVRSEPRLHLTKELERGGPARPGALETYVITLRNEGNGTARGVILTDPLPMEALRSATPSAGRVTEGTLRVGPADLPALAALPPGGSVTVRVAIVFADLLPAGATLPNQAFARAINHPEVVSDWPATPQPDDPTLITVDAPAPIEVTKTLVDPPDGQARAGQVIRYAFTVRPTTGLLLVGGRLLDALPAELVDPRPIDGRVVGGGVEWDLPDPLPPEGVTRFLEARVRPDVPPGTVIINQGEVVGPGVREPSRDPGSPDGRTRVTVVQRGELQITKRVEPPEARPGDPVVYRLTATNIGDAPVTEAALIDPVPAELEAVEAVGGAVAGGRATWSLPELAPGAAVTVELRARLREGLADALVISNQATGEAPGLPPAVSDDPTTPEPGDPTRLRVRNRTELRVTKVPSNRPDRTVRPGDRIDYQITLVNAGDVAATDVRVRDVISPLLTDPRAPGGQIVAGTVRWTLPRLEAGAQATFALTATVAADAPAGAEIANQAAVQANPNVVTVSDDPATAAPDDPTIVRVIGDVNLSGATKTVESLDGDTYRPGGRVRYTIAVTNRGNQAAQGVTLLDPVPPELDQVMAPGAARDGDMLEWRLGALAPGQSRTVAFTARIRTPLDDGTVVSNQGAVTAAGLAGAFPTDDPTTPVADATRFVVTAAPQVALSKEVAVTSGGPAAPGALVEYRLTLRNTGDMVARDVDVTDTLPPGLIEARPTAPLRLEGDRLVWRLDALAPGQAPHVVFSARIDPAAVDGQVIVNQARAGDLLSDDPALPGGADPTRLSVVDRPELAVFTKQVAGEFVPGGAVTYTLRVRNTGSRPAEAVRVVDPLSPELRFVGAEPPTADADGVLTWDLGRIEPGEERVVTLRALVEPGTADGTVVSNQATVSATGVAAIKSDDATTPEPRDPTRFTVVARPRLVVAKAVVDDNGRDFSPGDAITYTLTVRNEGNRPAAGVEVRDEVPRDLVGARAVEGSIEDGVARWIIPQLEPGAEVALELRARIRLDAPDGLRVVNTFVAQLPAGAPGAGEPVTSEEVAFIVRLNTLAPPAKTVRALGDVGFRPGEPIEYRIVVRNSLGGPAVDVTVEDTLDRARLVDIQPGENGVYDPRTGVVRWLPARTPGLAEIAPGAEVPLTVRARIGPAVPVGEQVRNQGRVAARGAAVVLTDDPATPQVGDATVFTVVGAPRVVVSKLLRTEGTIQAGDRVEYGLRVANRGDEPASGVVLSDALAPELIYEAGSTRMGGRPVPDVGAAAPFSDALVIQVPGAPPGVLPAGAAVDISFAVRVRPGTPVGRVVANQALTRVDGLDAVPSDDPRTPVEGDPTQFVVGGGPDIGAFIKRAEILDGDGSGRAQIGEVIEWRLEITNRAAVEIRGLRVVDPLPATARYVDASLDIGGGGVGVVRDGRLLATLDGIGAGQTRVVRFRTRVIAGPVVANQAFLDAAGISGTLPSDDDGDPRNGRNPTVVRVGDAPLRRVRVVKIVDDPTGPPAYAGDTLTYSITVRNEGSGSSEELLVVDDLPAGILVDGPVVAPGAGRVVVAPSPAGAFANGHVRVEGLVVPAGEEVTIVIPARVDPALSDRRRICNVARAFGPGLPPSESDGACVEAEGRRGRVEGYAFQDRDRDGRFDPRADLGFAGMRVAAYPMSDPDGRPTAQMTTEADGLFRLADLTPGRYRLRVFSGTEVLYAVRDDVEVRAGATLSADLLIDPTGRVYDSVEGDLLDDAELFIYRDEDPENDDPLDESSRRRRVLVPEEDLESPTQQGQRTAHGGLYKFAVRRPGRYIVEVVPPGPAWVSPSVLVPPTPGVAYTNDPDGFIVPEPLPSVEKDADRTYFLAFELRRPEDEYFNNHIPLDPLSSLIDLDKRASRQNVVVGQVVSYEIDIVNRSPQDLVHDPRTRTGGVYLHDTLPAGLKYVAGSAVLSRVGAPGEEVAISADDPAGVRLLRFGRIEERGGRRVLRPFDLRAGEVLRFRYQAVVGVDAKPRRTYTNRAQLFAEGNVPITRVAKADIRVLADPDFDQGLVLGKVFCDADGDGLQGAGERGLPGVRVFMDHGYHVVTDSAGQFHFKDIDPGTHAVKIDVGSLLPGGRPTTDELRVISFTRGLPAKVDFGVTCPAEVVDDPVVTAGDDPAEARPAGAALVIGNVNALSARVGEVSMRLAPPGLGLLADGTPAEPMGLRADAEGAAARLAFVPAIPEATRPVGWTLLVGPRGGEAVVIAAGEGPPPAHIPWDQRDLDGRPALKVGVEHTARLDLRLEGGALVGSPELVFGAGLGGAAPPELLATIPLDDHFGADGRPTRRGEEALNALRDRLLGPEGPRVGSVEVHLDGGDPDPVARATVTRRSERIAEGLAGWLTEWLNRDARVVARSAPPVVGIGGADLRPLVPNLSARNRARNRRIELRGVAPLADARPADSTGTAAAAEPAAPRGPAHSKGPGVVRVGRREVKPEKDGEFALVAEAPADGVIEVYVQAADGRRAMLPLRVGTGSTPARGEPRAVTLTAAGPGALTLGGAPLPPVEEIVSARWATEAGADPAAVELVSPKDAVRWRLVTRTPTGERRQAASGVGPPPGRMAWVPRLDGDETRLVVQLSDGALVAAPVLEGDAAPSAEPGAWLDGVAVSLDAAGQLTARAQVRPGEAVLVETQEADGRVIARFLVPPAPDREGEPEPVAFGAGEPALGAAAAVGGAALQPSAPGIAADAPPRPAAPPKPPAPVAGPTHTALGPEARAALAEFGRAEIAALRAASGGGPTDALAGQLRVELPPAGVTLGGRTLPIRGATDPRNRVLANGTELYVDDDGTFGGHVTLPLGEVEVVVEAIDPDDNRGTIRRSVVVPDRAWFLLAMGEGTVGAAGAELDGVEAHTSTRVGDKVYLHGRSAVYFKGYQKGDEVLGGLFAHYEATAHLDTARRREFEAYFRQLVDPELFYPTYGDSAEEVRDANTRGPLYVMIQADRSTLTVGNFRTRLRGIELLNYDRTLYGAQVDFDAKTGDFAHEVKVFAADLDHPERHAYVELLATGGSLYYLPHRELVEGSERVYLIERDKISGIERRRVTLGRNHDYNIRYEDGRILLKSPVRSTTLETTGALPQPGLGRSALDGHPVVVAVEYDHRDQGKSGDGALGVHARETYKDTITVGGGYVQETRGASGVPDYTLWGGELRLRHGRRTGLDLEGARSQSINGENLFSEDGGLTFRPFNSRDGAEARGTAYLLRAGVELDDVFGEGERDHVYLEGYYQTIAPGFYAGGTIQQQGLDKYGAAGRYHLNEAHTLRVQHDALVAAEPNSQIDTFYRAYERHVTRAGHTWQAGRLTLDTTWTHTESDEGPEVGRFSMDAATVGGQYRLTERWTLLFEQEAIVRGDARLHQSTADLFATTAGARYQASSDLQLELLETVRWSGDNATQLGARTELDERHTIYTQQRFVQRAEQVSHTSVLGGEERWGTDKSGRAYGEYQLDTGELGASNRAVLGVGKRTRLLDGLTLDSSYERSQVLAGGAGEFSQDAVSLGAEWLDGRKIKITGRYELRYEDNDELLGRRDRLQFLALHGLSLKLHKDLTMLVRLNYSNTHDLAYDATEAALTEGSIGFAYRPVDHNWLAVLVKYTKRFEQRPTDLSMERPEREENDVVSVIPIFELPWRFQLVEKLAWRRSALQSGPVPTSVSHTILWINRLNYHLTDTWDLGGEYRWFRNTLAQNALHGTLLEINYIVQRTVRIGVGYNFTSFSDDEFAILDENYGGPFFRVVAHY